ncbi:MAG: type ISP restriction/modification enzyme [Anaerolineaceae bacterium]
MTTSSETYIKAIEADYRRGNATEYTYRNALETFMESLGHGIAASNDPKHIQCGAPDFIIEKRKVPLGYVETKDLGVDLDKVERSDQMKRYLKALNNLILTDYLEFRWYVNGERKMTLRVADVEKNGRFSPTHSTDLMLEQLFRDFYATEAPTVTTPKELAVRLAGVTHFIRDQIIAALNSGDPDLQKTLNQQYRTFVDLLLPALKPEEFADLYAQAITYGLFAAKLSAPPGTIFAFEDAYKYLRANPFLRRLFMDVNEQVDEMAIIQPYLKDIVSLLNRADFASILADFGRRTRTEDPVVHFYETFLATYNPKMRVQRGVYYTPEPVVQFIVHSVDELLKTRFGKPWGLADDSVKVLDPASGTGTFLYFVIQQIHDELVNVRHQGGQWPEKSKEMLKRLFGFELLIAPYVVSHLKLGLQMEQLGAPLEGRDDRVHIYLTNTLEQGIERAEMLAGLGLNIAEESNEAARVKKADDIMVVLGNPPYSNFGMMNKGMWISSQLEDYKKGLNEKKINLDDDYIKFIRYGQLKLDKSGQGILALITNNSFLDGITHRIMRKSLLESFDEIYILNLHGNTNVKEYPPDGIVDKNIFDIQQGVSISIFIKSKKGNGKTEVYYSDIWGLREVKYSILSTNCISSIKWQRLDNIDQDSCLGKFRFFTPKAFDNIGDYCLGWPLDKIFVAKQNAIKTDRDRLVFDLNKENLANRMMKFYSADGIVNPFRDEFDIHNSSSYDLLGRRAKTIFELTNIKKCLYRPFDERWIYYSPHFTSRPAWDIMQYMIAGGNLGLLAKRQSKGEPFSYILCTNQLVESCVFESANANNSLFPLYINQPTNLQMNSLFSTFDPLKSPNLSSGFIAEFSQKLGLQFIPDGQGDLKATFGPEDVFYYTYAVFHSPTYRTRYAEFLKIDFPRLPLTSNKAMFARLVALGKELVELHLLKSAALENFITSYPVRGENRVEKVAYTNGSVYINPQQYFGGVPAEVWNFKIGGYQVCDKWLKDRKGRTLSADEISHYQRVVVALKETIRLMAEVDQTIPTWPME